MRMFRPNFWMLLAVILLAARAAFASSLQIEILPSFNGEPLALT